MSLSPRPTSWKVDSGKWVGNALRFAAFGQAEVYAQDLYARWTAVSKWRVVASDDPVTEQNR